MNRKKQSRALLIEQELNDFIERLKENYHPLKIILFGSAASKNINQRSDIDVIVIKETDKNFWERLREINFYCSKKIGMDVLIYTPEEFKQLSENRLFFKNEILKKGKVIYAK